MDRCGVRCAYSSRYQYWGRSWNLANSRKQVTHEQVCTPYGYSFAWTHILSPSDSIPAAPNPNQTATAQYILNDTSLAALALASGERQLYFQDNTGLIRQAVRGASSNEWGTGALLKFSSSIKNHTPLAVAAVVSDLNYTGLAVIILLRNIPSLFLLNLRYKPRGCTI